MRYSAFSTSRVRLLTLLLVATFSITAIGATTIASATDVSTAKKKKCKKGYKLVGKKCKKKKTGNPTATGIQLYMAEPVGSLYRVYGEVMTKSGFTSTKTITYTIVSPAGTTKTTGKAKGYGGRTEVNFTGEMAIDFAGGQTVQITAQVDSKVSNTLTVTQRNPSN